MDWRNEISEEERKSIKNGILDTDSAILKSHSEAMKLFEKW